MKGSRLLWALVVLNVVLLIGVGMNFRWSSVAHAQRMARGDYLMIPANIPGNANGVMYMVDTRNGLLSGFYYDNDDKVLIPIPPLNLTRLLEAGLAGGGVRPPVRRP